MVDTFEVGWPALIVVLLLKSYSKCFKFVTKSILFFAYFDCGDFNCGNWFNT
jgi:hypothetical protein